MRKEMPIEVSLLTKKKSKYKRKFKVPGNTIKDCWDFRKKCRKKYGKQPCLQDHPYQRDESRCPYPIHKPNDYIVSELYDGTWQCSCPAWKFRRKLCDHIRKAQREPEKYEIAVEFTGKTTDVLTKIFES